MTLAQEASADEFYWVPEVVSPPVQRAVTAAGIPIDPPSDWFVDPGLRGPSALTIDSDGHIYGHIATWQQSHIGLAGSVKAPRSRSNYAFFATGALRTAEGQDVSVGQITLVGGHAPIDVDTPRAVAHYDETKSAVADVAIGEDRHGIWVAGALRPDVDDFKVRVLRASAVSGDWRPINGHLELVAVCSVNVPGFPIPRARVASGQVLALVAAGVEPLVQQRLATLSAAAVMEAVDAVSSRVDMLEGQIVANAPELDTEADITVEVPLDAAPAPEPTEFVVAEADPSAANRLRYRVYKPLLEADLPETTDADTLRSRVHP